ncbi:MAG: TetR-like C-terminal domain-containing protein [Rhodoglobus sp.]
MAENLGVRVPSLYKHVDGMPALRRGAMLLAKTGLAAVMSDAAIGRSRDQALTAISIAYRKWALEHPGLYPLSVSAPVDGDEDDIAASSTLVETVYRVLAGYGLEGDDAVDATRFLRASLHGYVALETSGGFALPVHLERSFLRVIGSVETALDSWART